MNSMTPSEISCIVGPTVMIALWLYMMFRKPRLPRYRYYSLVEGTTYYSHRELLEGQLARPEKNIRLSRKDTVYIFLKFNQKTILGSQKRWEPLSGHETNVIMEQVREGKTNNLIMKEDF